MKGHLELLEVEPPAGLGLVEVVVEVSGREAERVELPGRRQQNHRGQLLIDNARVSALPPPHHVYLNTLHASLLAPERQQ